MSGIIFDLEDDEEEEEGAGADDMELDPNDEELMTKIFKDVCKELKTKMTAEPLTKFKKLLSKVSFEDALCVILRY